MSKPTEAQLQFASELALLKVKAGQLGLYCTMQLLEKPLRMVGYELAGTPELHWKMEDSYVRGTR